MSDRASGYADPSDAAVDVAALRRYRLGRVRDALHARDLPAILLYDPQNIRYATDATNMQVWTLHNLSRYALVPADGPVVLFEFHGCDHLARGLETVDEVRPATSWYYWGSGSRRDEHVTRWAAELAELIPGGRLAVDRLEPAGADALAKLGIATVDGQEVMEHARAVKSADELDAMRASLAVCEAGMQAMREALVPGVSENAVWAALHRVNIERGGEWIETRLLSSGPRTNPWFQECGPRRIEAGDLVSFDTDLIGPYGYCSDVSRAWLCGDGAPSDAIRRVYADAYAQVQRNVELLRPGLSFREYSEKGSTLADVYRPQRYVVVAHGVGLCDEYPSIPYAEDRARVGYDGHFEPGMTVCVESYAGEVGGPFGVKLEEQVLVTDSGAVPLSRYPYEESWL